MQGSICKIEQVRSVEGEENDGMDYENFQNKRSATSDGTFEITCVLAT